MNLQVTSSGRPTGTGTQTAAPPAAGSGPALAVAILVVLFALFCYADVLRILWIQWNTNEANSHGFLIPWISLYLVWLRREDLAGLRLAPAWALALLALVASLSVLLLGRLGGIVGLQEVSFVVTLWTLVVLLFGWRGLRALWFPIAFLLFMMPIWDLASEPLYYPLQLGAAVVAAGILSAFGVPVFRDGTFLNLPNVSVEVAQACSGINFLMSVLAIGTLLAYLMVRGTFRRLLVVAGAILIALLSNPVRVALITYLFYAGITTPSHSHMWQGLAVSVGAFAILFTFARALAEDESAPAPKTTAPAVPARATHRFVAVAASLAGCALLLAGGLMRPLVWPTPSLESLKLDSVPDQVGAWSAVPGDRPADPPAGIVQPDELWREYRNPAGRSVRVYVGRFGHTVDGQQGVRYWSDNFARITAAPVRTASGTAPANAALVFRERQATPVLYWYQAGGRQTTGRAEAKLYAAWNAVTRVGVGPIAVVIFGNPAEDLAASRATVEAFAREFVPAIASRFER